MTDVVNVATFLLLSEYLYETFLIWIFFIDHGTMIGAIQMDNRYT